MFIPDRSTYLETQFHSIEYVEVSELFTSVNYAIIDEREYSTPDFEIYQSPNGEVVVLELDESKFVASSEDVWKLFVREAFISTYNFTP